MEALNIPTRKVCLRRKKSGEETNFSWPKFSDFRNFQAAHTDLRTGFPAPPPHTANHVEHFTIAIVLKIPWKRGNDGIFKTNFKFIVESVILAKSPGAQYS